jgi:hypothetical protein
VVLGGTPHGHDELIAFNYPNIVQKLDGANMISAKQNRGKEQIVCTEKT